MLRRCDFGFRRRWARAIGAFDAESLGVFGTGVATGRIRTDEIAELPILEVALE